MREPSFEGGAATAISLITGAAMVAVTMVAVTMVANESRSGGSSMRWSTASPSNKADSQSCSTREPLPSTSPLVSLSRGQSPRPGGATNSFLQPTVHETIPARSDQRRDRIFWPRSPSRALILTTLSPDVSWISHRSPLASSAPSDPHQCCCRWLSSPPISSRPSLSAASHVGSGGETGHNKRTDLVKRRRGRVEFLDEFLNIGPGNDLEDHVHSTHPELVKCATSCSATTFGRDLPRTRPFQVLTLKCLSVYHSPAGPSII